MGAGHIIKRAMERYGIRINRGDIAAMLSLICRGEAAKVRGGTNGDEEWELDFRGKMLRVVTVPDDRRAGRLFVATIVPAPPPEGFKLGDALK